MFDLIMFDDSICNDKLLYLIVLPWYLLWNYFIRLLPICCTSYEYFLIELSKMVMGEDKWEQVN